jgi:hypothetical protein
MSPRRPLSRSGGAQLPPTPPGGPRGPTNPLVKQGGRRARFGYAPGYEGDEIAVGIAITLAIHAIPIALLVLKAAFPNLLPKADDEPTVARPVVAASLLKLGRPIDPSKLPDRLIPRASTVIKHEVVASREEPKKPEQIPDAGAKPPLAKESDIQRLLAKSDPFAEDGGKDRPQEGRAEGIEGGTETDPNKVHAGDMYAAKLGQFLHDRWQYPTVISQGEANRLCVVFQIALNRFMTLWHLRMDPIKKSGNDLFDDSAREMLQKLLDEHTPLPEPPPEVQDMYRGRTVNIALAGDLHGDTSKCR